MTTCTRALCAGVLLAFPLLAGVGLHFEENRGQTDKRVEWLARGPGYSAFVSGDGAVFGGREGSVRMRLAGASRGRGEGLEALPGVSHYLRGGDGSGDVTGARHFGKVRYKGVYPGVDLVYYGNERQLEYDFVVAAGADPSRIRLRFEGAGALHTDAEGNLALSAGLVLRKPVLYQETDGGRREVRGAFRVRGREVSFDVGRYRRDLPLVIDPVLAYASVLGGRDQDEIKAVGVDAAGNVYVGGDSRSSDFPGAPPTPVVFWSGSFVSKFDPTGTTLLYTAWLGPRPGNPVSTLNDLAVLPDGRVAVVGMLGLSSTPGAYSEVTSVPGNVAILNASGSGFGYVAFVQAGGRIAVTSKGEAIVAGGTLSREPSTDAGSVYQMSSDGSRRVWARTFVPRIYDVSVDAADNVLVAGWTNEEARVWKLSPNGADQVSRSLAAARPMRLVVGPGGDVWVAGDSDGGISVTPGAYGTTTPTEASVFLLRLRAADLDVVFGTWLGAGRSVALAVEPTGEAVVGGTMKGPFTANAFSRDGSYTLLKLDAEGRRLLYGTAFPATVTDLAVAPGGGGLWVSGDSSRGTAPRTANAFQRELRGTDGYFARVEPSEAICSYSASPATLTVGPLPAFATVSVTASSGCAWAVTTRPDWVVSTTSGVGTGTLQFRTAVNERPVARSGVMMVAGVTVSVTQSASTCDYRLSVSEVAMGPEGGFFQVGVTTSPDCIWTARSLPGSFLSIERTVTGSGVVEGHVVMNEGLRRTGTVTVAGQPVLITQRAGACGSAFSPTVINAPGAGGTFFLERVTSQSCPSLLSPSDLWITVPSDSASGPSFRQVIVAPNSGAARSGSVFPGAQVSIPIHQAAAGGCSFGVGAATAAAGASGGTGDVAVTASSSACAWNANSGAAWLQVYPLSGTGPGSVRYTALPNFTGLARSAMVSVSGQTFTVSQPASTATANERFVQSVYFGAFGRLPSPAEVAFHLQGGTPGAALVNAFLASPEFAAGAKFVAGLYVGLLGRDAEYGGWQFQRDALVRADVSPHGLVGNFLGAAEYAARFGTPDNAGFVRLLYRNILGREATAEEVAFQAAGITGPAARTNLAVTFLGSEEFKRRTGPRLTAFLLHSILWRRGPSEWELDQQADRIAAGTPLTTLIQEMLPAQ